MGYTSTYKDTHNGTHPHPFLLPARPCAVRLRCRRGQLARPASHLADDKGRRRPQGCQDPVPPNVRHSRGAKGEQGGSRVQLHPASPPEHPRDPALRSVQQYPRVAAGACAAYVLGRVLYTVGYTSGDPKKRNIGILGSFAFMTLVGSSLYTSARMVLDGRW